MTEKNVLVGVDSWAFLHQGAHRQFDHLLGILKPAARSIENFANNISTRNAYFDSASIPWKHIVFPCKPVVQKHLLPKSHTKIESIFEAHYQGALIRHRDLVIYPLDELQKRTKKTPMFQKYDTHNSNFGFLEITNLLCRNVNVPPLFENDFTVKTQTKGGDLAKMMNSQATHEETILVPKKRDFYTIGNRSFIVRNTNDIQIIRNDSAKTPKRLLIFGDSFFKGMLRYLKMVFSEIVYIRSTFLHKEIVENYQPDVVFSGGAERYLAHVQSDRQAHNFMLALYGEPKYKPSKEYLEAFQAVMSHRHYPYLYQAWLEKIRTNAYSIPIGKAAMQLKPDILRNVAIYFEETGDTETALKLMTEAQHLRPLGETIKNKCIEYQKKLIRW